MVAPISTLVRYVSRLALGVAIVGFEEPGTFVWGPDLFGRRTESFVPQWFSKHFGCLGPGGLQCDDGHSFRVLRCFGSDGRETRLRVVSTIPV